MVVTVHDVSEAVKARVTKKLERAVIVPNAVINQAAQRAGDMTSPKYVAQALSQTLCKKLPEKLQKNGVTVKMAEVYRENNFVVLQLQVIHVNPLTMASSWSEIGIGWILDSMSASFRQMFEDDYRELDMLRASMEGDSFDDTFTCSQFLCLPFSAVPNMLTSLLAATIPKMLDEKMADKKIDAETKVLRAKDQSFYFYSKLNQLRTEEWDQKGSRNPIRTLRRRMSGSSLGGTPPRYEDEVSLDATSVSTFSVPLQQNVH
jgi:hypothetical protein